MHEHDVVELTEAHEGWGAGTRGTLVSEPADGVALVEFSDDRGRALDIPYVSLTSLRVVTAVVSR